VDGDGDLDVIAGNDGQTNRLYLNNGTANPFNGVTGMNITSDAHNTRSLALGDVDGDGDLDVIAGNDGQTNRLYLNNGTADPFNSVIGKDISPDVYSTYAIALGDVDGNGHLDVVVGNYGSANRLYLNNGTYFEGGYVPTYTLTLTKTGTGSGTVTADSGTINWSDNIGTATYNRDTLVTLSATPDSGSVFTGWSGACTGTGICSVTMDAAKNVTATFSLTTYLYPTSAVMEEARGLMSSAKIVLAVGTGAQINLAGIVANAAFNATQQGNFAVYDLPLNSYPHGYNCDSDALPDDPFPSSVILRFAVAQTGEYVVGAMGPDNDVLATLAYGGGSAYGSSNDPNLIYASELYWDLRANQLAAILSQEYLNRVVAGGYATGGAQNSDQFWTLGQFDLYNGFSKSIFQVYTGIFHQQADFGWYPPENTAFDQLMRTAWSPATALDANMTLQRNASFSYSGVIAAMAETYTSVDNGNNAEIFLDSVSTGYQANCGVIARLFPETTPGTVQIAVNSTWSVVGNYYRGAFVADSVTATSWSEACD
jgi:hypothetical protein